jgi:hypothetical protein
MHVHVSYVNGGPVKLLKKFGGATGPSLRAILQEKHTEEHE